MKKFLIHTMGCKSNQFESSVIKENLEAGGLIAVKRIEDADIYILNSCTVTHKSDNEALYLLRNAKHKNSKITTVLTGCLAQIEKEKLIENNFIDYVIGNDEKLDLCKCLASGQQCSVSDIMHLDKFHYVHLADTSKTRASLKIQDGCDNRCSYCIIPFARGKSRSADKDFIISQIKDFEDHGFKEVVFTGIHIGYDTFASQNEHAAWLVGATFRYAYSKQEGIETAYGGDGKLNEYSGKVYATWMHESGSYMDILAQIDDGRATDTHRIDRVPQDT